MKKPLILPPRHGDPTPVCPFAGFQSSLMALFLLLAGAFPALAQSRIAELTPVGGFTTDNYANRVQVVGKFAFIADGLAGLVVIDVSNPRVRSRSANWLSAVTRVTCG